MYPAVHRQIAPTLSSEIVESDFSDTAYNSAYVSDAFTDFDRKTYFATIFRLNFFDTKWKCLMRYGIYKKQTF